MVGQVAKFAKIDMERQFAEFVKSDLEWQF